MPAHRRLIAIACGVLLFITGTIPALAQNQDSIEITGTIASTIGFSIAKDTCDFGSIDSSTEADHICTVVANVTSNTTYNLLTCATADTTLDLSHLSYDINDNGFSDFTSCGTGSEATYGSALTSQPATGGFTTGYAINFQLHVAPTDPLGTFGYTVEFLAEASS